MANEFDIDTILGQAVLTAPVQKLMNQLPRPLPDALYNQTNNILGDRYRRVTFRGTRQSSKRARYGAPPTMVQRTGLGSEDMVMIHSIEETLMGNPLELQKLFRGYDNYDVRQGLTFEFDRQGADFAMRQQNLVTTAIHSAIAYFKIGFDSNNDITTNFGTAAEVIDYGLPAGNIVTSSVNWADPSANLVGYFQNFLIDAQRSTGWPITWAICGKNVAQYIANNTAFQTYLRYTQFADQYKANPRVIPNGVMGLNWVFAGSAYYQRPDGTNTEIFPADQITLLPDLTRDFYELQQGSFMVPKQFNFLNGPDFNPENLSNTINAMYTQVYGPFRYAYGVSHPILQIEVVQGNTFIPDFKRTEACWILDTTP